MDLSLKALNHTISPFIRVMINNLHFTESYTHEMRVRCRPFQRGCRGLWCHCRIATIDF